LGEALDAARERGAGFWVRVRAVAYHLLGGRQPGVPGYWL